MAKNMSRQYQKETICIQSGWQPKNGEPRVLPVYQSTTFKYESSEQMGRLFDLEESGYFYSRLQNPTNDCVAAKICELEGGVAAMLTASGQAACHYAVFNICEAGDHVVLSSTVYGGTFNLITCTMKKMGIECTVVDPDAPEEELARAFQPNTRCVFAETIANPALVVLDIEKFAKAAHEHQVPLIVDNTFATPVNCNPFKWGADIVIHSTTKYMDGHAVSLGGCIVDSGNFDWNAYPDKFPGLCTPDESYHGITYTEKFGKAAYITKATTQLMRDLGSMQSPQNAFLLNIGLETLSLRMERHCYNAQKTAEYLEAHENRDGDMDSLFSGAVTQGRRRILGCLQQINRLPVRRRPLVQLGEVDDVVHQRDQPRRLRADHAHKPGHVLRLDKPVFQ